MPRREYTHPTYPDGDPILVVATDLARTLAAHALWLTGGPGGTQANLEHANLTEANLGHAKLPAGWLWWQGGASGPHRRQMRVWRPGAGAEIVAHQGCIRGTPDDVAAALVDRHDNWASDYGDDLAKMWLAESLGALETGVCYIERRAAAGFDRGH